MLVDETKEIRREARNFSFTACLMPIPRGQSHPTRSPGPVRRAARRVSVLPSGRIGRTSASAAVQPLYRSVPQAARRDPALYDLLALVDALRIGQAGAQAMALPKKKSTISLSLHAAAQPRRLCARLPTCLDSLRHWTTPLSAVLS